MLAPMRVCGVTVIFWRLYVRIWHLERVGTLSRFCSKTVERSASVYETRDSKALGGGLGEARAREVRPRGRGPRGRRRP